MELLHHCKDIENKIKIWSEIDLPCTSVQQLSMCLIFSVLLPIYRTARHYSCPTLKRDETLHAKMDYNLN